jgi:3-(3-hydroxy-phenyl)propionate hydroxylase
MEAKLRECAAADHGDRIDVRYGAEVTGVDQDADGVTVTAKDTATGETTTVRARYAIAADGGSSAVRKQLGITMTGDTLDVQWIVIDCKAKRWWPDRDLLTFWSDKERPVVDIALSAGNHRWEMPLKPGETPEDFPTNDQVWPLLNALGKTSDDVDIHQYAFYRHHTRMADHWREGRVFLAGDAAHIVPPTGAKGMNLAVADVRLLARALAAYYRDRREDLLAAYTATASQRVWRATHFSWWMTHAARRPRRSLRVAAPTVPAAVRDLVPRPGDGAGRELLRLG